MFCPHVQRRTNAPFVLVFLWLTVDWYHMEILEHISIAIDHLFYFFIQPNYIYFETPLAKPDSYIHFDL